MKMGSYASYRAAGALPESEPDEYPSRGIEESGIDSVSPYPVCPDCAIPYAISGRCENPNCASFIPAELLAEE